LDDLHCGQADLSLSPILFPPESFINNKPETNKKGALSSRANLSSEQQRKKTKAKSTTDIKKRKKQAPERDDLRPQSEQDLFTPLQVAKEKQRKAVQVRNSQQKPASTMVKTRTTAEDEIPGKKTVQQPEDLAASVSQDSTSSPGTSETSSPNPNPDSASTSEKRPRPQSDDGTDYASMTDDQIDALCSLQLEKDKKVKLNDRMKLIARLRKRMLELRRAFGTDLKTQNVTWDQLKDQNKGLKVALAKKKLEVDTLTAENEALVAAAGVRLSRAKAQVLKMCNDTQNKVFSTAKNVLFHTVKFINCKDDLYDATEKVHDMLHLGKTVTNDQRDSWVETYASVVKQGINTARNYVVSELKKVAFMQLAKRKPLLLTTCCLHVPRAISRASMK
jgi:hypothetical protein